MSGYRLIDSGDQKKLERFGEYLLVRPSSQAVWSPEDPTVWRNADGTFVRGASGTGHWSPVDGVPRRWTVQHADTVWHVMPNEFGNLGMFPEQEPCWQWIRDNTQSSSQVLNLFGYTGGSTLAAARAGAHVCHVDASKTVVRVARDNAEASGLGDAPVRWITEDASRFVEREIRRGRRYHGVILDPPSYGRGPKGEVWKIDEQIQVLLALCVELLADDRAYMLLTSHSPGYTPAVLSNLVEPGARGPVESGEMIIRDAADRPLPSGAYARWTTGAS